MQTQSLTLTFAKDIIEVSDGKVKGRVARLLVTPLLRALEKTIGNNEFISFVDSFRYPLAGNFLLGEEF